MSPKKNDLMPRPLEGVRVLDLTRLLPGAHCTLLLADMGAEVIKVEDPWEGDYYRRMPPLIGGYGAYFRAFNTGKKSVTINLKTKDGRRVLFRLSGLADVLVESFRPDAMTRMGIDYSALQTINPRLVFCSLSGYGQTGPYRSRAGHDLNYIGLAGFFPSSRTDTPQSGKLLEPPQVQVADIGGGYAASLAILAALYARQQTGGGTYLDISLAEVAISFAAPRLVLADCIERGQSEPSLVGEELSGAFACYNVYRTSDNRYVTLGALEPKFWKAFLSTVGREDLLDQQFELSRQTELRTIVAEIFMLRSQAEWLSLLGGVGKTCCEPVHDPLEVLHDSHFQSRGMFCFPSPGSRSVLQVATPNGSHPPRRTPAPSHGEHTTEVLEGCGFSQEEILDLRRSRAI